MTIAITNAGWGDREFLENGTRAYGRTDAAVQMTCSAGAERLAYETIIDLAATLMNIDNGFGFDMVMHAAWAIFNSEIEDMFTERWLANLAAGGRASALK
jgi:hypothetical protein